MIVECIWYFQCGLFVGSSPTKNAHNFLKVSDQNPMSKNSKIIISNFGSKNCANRCILVSEVRYISFFDEKPILKIFDFWT